MPWSRAQPRVAWFGKLPGQGDFVGRRMPRAMSGAWDEWLSHGLGHLRSTAHGDWERTFTQAPLWSFVASGGKGAAPSCGVLAPSIDRVGRCYPLTVMAVGEGGRQSLAADGVLGQFFSEACDAVIEARRLALPADALDTRLSRLPWPFAATAPDGRGQGGDMAGILSDLGMGGTAGQGEAMFSRGRDILRAGQAASFWWSYPPGAGGRSCEHWGVPNESLFLRLFGGGPNA
ncbi:type VI secretion system-associated protein TagF [Paracidovorax citrulli]|nr:type VI secretion system-associated protein TagF [Paracidovorax citrulli]UMT86426.1 type VI secretion system-associated protein TagF [Paracidovorax citrulli]UMT90621.1 type VI secretion system-associated protein TagF [Paracidovorax citrulli]UMT97687.1 type VI secretion system-associated protein TagF [Paracidovorax citrulli]